MWKCKLSQQSYAYAMEGHILREGLGEGGGSVLRYVNEKYITRDLAAKSILNSSNEIICGTLQFCSKKSRHAAIPGT